MPLRPETAPTGGFLPNADLSKPIPEDTGLSTAAKVTGATALGAGMLFAPALTLGAMATVGGGALLADSEGAKAAFRQENTIGSWMASGSRAFDGPAEEGYDPWADIAGTPYEEHWENFAPARSKAHADTIKADIDREVKDKKYLESQGAVGFAQGMAAGIFDPTILLPGGAVVRNARGGVSALRSAGSVAAYGAGGAALTEGVLQATQQTRTGEESAMAIAGATVLSGLLGAGLARRAAASQVDAWGKAIEDDLGRGPDDPSAPAMADPVRTDPLAPAGEARDLDLDADITAAKDTTDALTAELEAVASRILPDSVKLQVVENLRADGDRVKTGAERLSLTEDVARASVPQTRIVDEAGAPIKVYHGTGAAEFSEFDPSRSVEGGVFFASDPSIAKDYDFKGKAPRVVEAYVDIRNPKIIDAGGQDFSDAMLGKASEEYGNKFTVNDLQPELAVKQFGDYPRGYRSTVTTPAGQTMDILVGLKSAKEISFRGVGRREFIYDILSSDGTVLRADQEADVLDGDSVMAVLRSHVSNAMTNPMFDNSFPRMFLKQFIDQAKAEGHDGVWLRNGMDMGREPHDQIVAFRVDQIKTVSPEGANAVDEMFSIRKPAPGQTPAFEKWFRGSKIVDENGKPLVMYHGTKADVAQFDPKKFGASDEGLAGKGFYFTYNPEEASGYALNETFGKGDSPNVIPAYIDLKNPLVITQGVLPDGRTMKDLHGGIGINSSGGAAVRALAEAGGHDGVVWASRDGAIRHAVAWKPEQIKSATGNRGTFDPNDPRISYSIRKETPEQQKLLQKGAWASDIANLKDALAEDFPSVRRRAEGNEQGLAALDEMEAATKDLVKAIEGDTLADPAPILARMREASARLEASDVKGSKLATQWVNRVVKKHGESFSLRSGDATATPQFKKWFGDSKVVDEAGAPLRVYHGSPSGEIKEFDIARGRSGDLRKAAVWFSADPKYAEEFTGTTSDAKGPIYPVYLAIKNPVDIGDVNRKVTFPQFLTEIGIPADAQASFDLPYNAIRLKRHAADEVHPAWFWYSGSKNFAKELKAQGYDGAIGMEAGARVYAALEPTQIKSVFNKGTFDPNDPRISNAIRPGESGPIAEGSFNRSNLMVTISRAALDPVGTLHHEAVHALKEVGTFSQREWRSLENAARNKGWLTVPEMADYAKLYDAAAGDPRLTEEAIAMAYQRWARGEEKLSGVNASTFARIKKFLAGVRDALIAKFGDEKPEDIFARIDSGAIASRADGRKRARAAGSQAASSVGAAAAQTGDYRLKPTGTGIERGLARLAPGLWLQNASSRVARQVADELQESGIYRADHADWFETARGGAEQGQYGAVESRVKTFQGQMLADGFKAIDDAFMAYRKGSDKRRTGDITVTSLSDYFTGSGNKLDFKQFREAVGRAMAEGDTHQIPEVAGLAKKLRPHFDKWKDEAIKLGLLPEGVTPETAPSYMMRAYDRKKIIDQRPEFKKVIVQWLGEVEKANARVRTALQGHVRELEDTEGEISATEKRMEKRAERAKAAEKRRTEETAKAPRYQGPEMSADDIDTVAGFWSFAREMRSRPKPESLAAFVTRMGGVEDPGGDILSAIGRYRDRPGLIRKGGDTSGGLFGPGGSSGRGLDDWALRAWEDGFFPNHVERPTANEFLDMLADDLAGDGTVVRSDDQGYFEDLAAAREMEEELGQYGVTVNQFKKEHTLRSFFGQDTTRAAREDAEAARQAQDAEDQEAIAVRQARAKELEKLIEEQVSAYQGKTAGEAQSAIEARRKANETRDPSAKRRPEEMLKPVRDAAEKIAGQEPKDPAELPGLADQIISRILGTPEGRLPYDAPSTKQQMFGSDMDARGPLAARQFMIPDKLIEPWLERDMDILLRQYAHTMISDIELAKRFGTPDMINKFKEIDEDYSKLLNAAKSDGERRALQREKDETFRNVAAIRDRLRGTYKIPEDPDAIMVRTARTALTLSFLSKLGGMTVAAMTDPARFVMVNGLGKTFSDGLVPLFTNFSQTRKTMRELEKLHGAAEMIVDSRALRMADVSDTWGQNSLFERVVQSGGRNFGMVSLMAPWNATMKQFASVLTLNRVMRNAVKRAEGKTLSSNEQQYMAFLGLSEGVTRRIGVEFKANGVKKNGLWLPNTDNWSPESRNAIDALSVALRKSIDTTIVTPGLGEKPKFASTLWGALLLQFKSFALSATQRMLIAGLQQRDAAAVNGALLSVVLGGLVYYLKGEMAGKPAMIPKSIDDPNWGIFMGEAFDRSGLAGILMEANNITEKVTRGTVGLSALTGKPISRYASRNTLQSVAGPVYGMAEDALAIAGSAFDDRPWTQKDTHRVRQVLPYQNLFYLRSAIDKVEAGVNSALGIPERASAR